MNETKFEIKQHLTPIVVRKSNTLKFWSCLNWSSDDWISKCSMIKFLFRLHFKKTKSESVIWENEAIDTIVSNLKDYLDWKKDKMKDDNPFRFYSTHDVWAYTSYNHLSKLSGSEQLISSINWSKLDFGSNLGKDGKDTTFWLGCNGASTPCHYDSYGYNLVAQIKGKKLWILFPFTDSKYLYPTRIPYEESSIFSDVNIENPDLVKHPLYSKTHPYHIVLEKGDLLYVPQHWWHFVKTIDDDNGQASISANIWLPLEDDLNHLKEAIVHFLCTALFPCYKPEEEDWLLDTFNFFTPKEAINYVKLMIKKHSSVEDTRKIERFPSNISLVEPQNPILTSNPSKKLEQNSGSSLTSKEIINSILDPSVISLIAENLQSCHQSKHLLK